MARRRWRRPLTAMSRKRPKPICASASKIDWTPTLLTRMTRSVRPSRKAARWR
jgi:hypothetical protein